MSRALLTNTLGKSSALIIGIAGLGGSASIPSVKDILSPNCFDFSSQLKKREGKVQEANGESSAEMNSTNSSSEWAGKFNEAISNALKSSSNKNICYSAITTLWLFSDGFDGKSGEESSKWWEKIRWRGGQERVKSLIGCSGEDFNGPLKKIKERLGKVGLKDANGAGNSGQKPLCSWLDNNSDDSNRTETNISSEIDWALWDIVLCGLLINEHAKGKWGEKLTGVKEHNGTWGLENMTEEEKKSMLSSGNYFEGAAIKIPVEKEWDGELKYYSSCVVATTKR